MHKCPHCGYVELRGREKQVASMLARGICNKNIARHLRISHNAVTNYIRRANEKIGLESTLQLALYAQERGWGKRRVPPSASALLPSGR